MSSYLWKKISDTERKKLENEAKELILAFGDSLEKLPKYLEKAYSLATMNDTIKKAQESAQAEANSGAAGIISSVPSNSPEGTDATLTPTERELAKRMGVSEDKWLERKKQINSRNEGR